MEDVGLQLQDHIRNEGRVFALEPWDLADGVALHVGNDVPSKSRGHVCHQLLLVECDPVIFAVKREPGKKKKAQAS